MGARRTLLRWDQEGGGAVVIPPVMCRMEAGVEVSRVGLRQEERQGGTQAGSELSGLPCPLVA